MLLDIKKDKIKYIALDSCYYYYGTKPSNKTNFSDFVDVVDLGNRSQDPKYNGAYFLYSKSVPCLSKYKGIFLGTQTDIDNIINSKLNNLSPSTFKKIYFDPNCKYPRFKLNALTSIKRCLDPSKADSVIIHQDKFDTYISSPQMCSSKSNKYIILHSVDYDCYYLIDYYPERLHNSTDWAILNQLINQYSSDNTSKLHS